MTTLRLSREAARAELERRQALKAAAFTIAAFCMGHAHQERILQSTYQNLVLMCSRRAGKTRLCCALLLFTALATPDVSCVYLGLNKKAAAKIWLRHWKPLLRKFGITAKHNETDQITTLPNGSTIAVGGLDDMRHVQTLLGDSMASGMAVIDEAQSDPGLIQTVAQDILGPMLDETTVDKPVPGRLVIAGTVPDTPAGYFWELWEENFDETTGETKEGAEWGCFAWSRFDNPHLTDNEERLAKYLAKYKLEREDPIVLRLWYGKRVFEKEATAYGWQKRNSYVGVSPAWVEGLLLPPGQIMAAELPPGAAFGAMGEDSGPDSDRTVVEVVVWSHARTEIVHVFEWATEKAAQATQSQWAAAMGEVKRRWPHIAWQYVYDASGAQEVIDTFNVEYGIPAVLPAKKAAMYEQVKRAKDLLMQGKARVMAGSKLEEDLRKVRWDIAQRAKGKWVQSKAHHGDASEAWRYALGCFFGARPEVKPLPTRILTEDEQLAEMARANVLERMKDWKPDNRGRPGASILKPRATRIDEV